ncbi:DNA polymerase III subunit gamma and tau [Microbacterium sp. gxy059]|uniref:DNA polymerase III subunit gamma and tau n=1 Tax=Microbacterium sp. gxy059 TaxID=2957199 RepID=UPI003D97643B
MSTALYRRYRPENFGEMIGQSQVTDPLMTALRSDRIGHAYLFSGPRGCGKTTSARILARCLNCAEGPTDTPCGVCESCVELSRAGGGSLDVVEIDAASHNGVDDARDLRERAIFAPARDRYKIFILDEAHMVTAQGFNALLKLVEEPPAHVKFIFATTEPEKVIGTIRSRTHHYPFRLVPPAAMLEYVESLCTQEGIAADPGVLPLVVRAGAGSPRDTLSILDQLIAGSEGASVSYERAVALLGYTHGELLDEVVDAFATGDAAAAFSAVDRVVQTGQDPRRFVDDLLERLRDLLIIAATGQGAAAVLRGLPSDELARMQQQAERYGSARVSRAADLVSAALDGMTGATSPRLHLELMIARVLTADQPQEGAAPAAPRAEAAAPLSAPAQAAPGPEPAGPRAAAAPAQAAAPAAPPAAAPPTSTASPATAPRSAPAAAAPPAAAPPAAAPTASPTAPPADEALAASPTASPAAAPSRAESAGASPAAAPPVAPPSGDAAPGPAAAPPTAPPAGEPTAAPGSTAAPSAGEDAERPTAESERPDAGAREAAAPSAPAARPPAPGADDVPAAGWATVAPGQGAAPAAPAEREDAQAPTEAAAPAVDEAGAPAAPEAAAPTADDASAPAAPAEPAAAASDPEEPPTALTLESVRADWPRVMSSLEQISRSSWLVLQAAQVAHVADDVLGLAFTNQADLQRFKTRGPDGSGVSEDLRTAIIGAIGARVKFLARHVPREPQTPQGSQAPPIDDEPPADDDPGEPGPPPEDPPEPPPAPHGGAARPATSGYDAGSSAASGWTVAPVPGGAPAAEPSAAPAEPAAPAAPPPFAAPVADDAPAERASAPAPQPEEPSGPTVQARQVQLSDGVQRYGEAVVRQKLGARFLREEPYESSTRFQ